MTEDRGSKQYDRRPEPGPSNRPLRTFRSGWQGPSPFGTRISAEEYEALDEFIPWSSRRTPQPAGGGPTEPISTTAPPSHPVSLNSGNPNRLSILSFASTMSNAESFVTMNEGRPDSFVGLRPSTSIRTTSSTASNGSYVTARHNDLVKWDGVFSPSHAQKSMRELARYKRWMVSGDRLAYSDAGASDDLLIYDIGSDDTPLEPSLPWDRWQLTPDGFFIFYSQGQSIHLYSLEHRRVTYSSPFEGRWTSICETSVGLVIATAFGELFFWNPLSGPPQRLKASSTSPSQQIIPELQWVRCHASLKTPYCCVFGPPSPTIQVFNTDWGKQKLEISMDGIGAQIGVIKCKTGQRKPVIAVLERQPEGLKLYMRYLELSDDSGPMVFEPQHIPFPDGYNPKSPTQALSCILLLVEHLSCIVVLLSLSQTAGQRNPIARARIHDALDGNMIMQEDVDVDLSEIRTDGMGRILKRASDETIERLQISEERLKFHRDQQALAMAQW